MIFCQQMEKIENLLENILSKYFENIWGLVAGFNLQTNLLKRLL